jgi:hypothetical protein
MIRARLRAWISQHAPQPTGNDIRRKVITLRAEMRCVDEINDRILAAGCVFQWANITNAVPFALDEIVA